MSDVNVERGIGISVTVDDVPLPVHSADIVLGVNAIPRLEMACAVGEMRQDAAGVDVMRVTLPDAADRYERLSQLESPYKAQGLTNAMITLGGESVKLEGWLMTDVGMSKVDASQAPYLSVVAQHPIFNLAKVGSVFEIEGDGLRRAVCDRADRADGFVEVYDHVLGEVANSQDYVKTEYDVMKKFRTSLGDEKFLPGTYLHDETKGKTFLGVDRELMNRAIAGMVMPDGVSASIWEGLLSSSGVLLMNVVQDGQHNFSTDKLVIEPFRPWKETGLKIPDSWCSSVDMFGDDSFFLAGVMSRFDCVASMSVTQGILPAYNVVKRNRLTSIYVPDPIKDDLDISKGRIMKTSIPTALAAAICGNASTGEKITASRIKSTDDVGSSMKDAMESFCRTVYELSAKSMSRGAVDMSLRLRDEDGKMILPGMSCQIVSVKDGKERSVAFGYVHGVVHHLSMDGECRTRIVMSHVRPAKDYVEHGEILIQYGSENHAWKNEGS